MRPSTTVTVPLLLTGLCMSNRIKSEQAEGTSRVPVQMPDSEKCPDKRRVLNLLRRSCPLALRGKSNGRIWYPWAYEPRCEVENTQGMRKEDRKRNDQRSNRAKYCLYTNTFFGEYGISVLSRPQAASNIADILLDAYESSFPSLETVQNLNLDPAFQVVDMPDKGGKGIVATRQINMRETFMIDYASIVGDLDMWGSIPEDAGRAILDKAAEQLVDPQQVLNLGHGAGGVGVEGIVRANTFRTYLDGVPQKTLFPKISVKLFPISLVA